MAVDNKHITSAITAPCCDVFISSWSQTVVCMMDTQGLGHCAAMKVTQVQRFCFREVKPNSWRD